MVVIIFFVDSNLKNTKLSKLIDLKKLEQVNKPIEAANGLPNECTFDCGRFFTSFLTDCNRTIHAAFSSATVSEYIAFGDECSRMDPMSMVRAVDSSICTTCGDNVTRVPLEECDDGEDNSYLADACRPNCRLPFCGDGVQDSAEFCDDGEANAVDGACLPDCTRP